MIEFLQVSTTTASRADAERIAQELVTHRLAACVQIIGPVQSTYRWQGTVETVEEWLCQIKTTQNRWEALQQALRAIHPYEVPELVAVSIERGSPDYLNWLADQVDNQNP
ncbi:MAG: divalent-cation tolerance protein CutA [Pirellulales bacterium]|nr:divalent-cation tolerance protein CutA [Pirellulales bacterium]